MPFYRQEKQKPVPNQPPPAAPRLPVSTPSPIMNVLGRGLNKVLPQQLITEALSQSTNSTPTTANHERQRAFIALDWLARTWVPRWSLIVPDAGQQLASALTGSPAICDLQTAEAAGALIMTLSDGPENAETFVAENYKNDNFYDMAAVKAARQASATAVADAAGTAVADASASVILEECLAARTDIAFTGISALALLHCLDGVWPYIQNWANGPGDFDAKRISIGNLAPVAARQALNPITEALQQQACGLYVELCQLG